MAGIVGGTVAHYLLANTKISELFSKKKEKTGNQESIDSPE